jgi:hypothetical protein
MPTSTDLINSSSSVTDHNTTIDSSDAIDTSDDDNYDDHAYELDDELIFKQSRRVYVPIPIAEKSGAWRYLFLPTLAKNGEFGS